MKFDHKKIQVRLAEKSYPIYVGENTIGHRDLWWPDYGDEKVFVVTDATVAGLYAPLFDKLFGPDVRVYEISPGEQSKSFSNYQAVLEWMIENGATRQSVLVAFGGGVVGDLAGFVAATVLRGIQFIQMPTTLLAQVDSSVGGKTGINSRAGKNLIGAFYQPGAVVVDTETLKTLPRREILAGYAEIVKHGLLGDARFFKWLEDNGARVIALETDALVHAIEKSCAMKAEIVRQDEHERTGLRALLNLGHTFAHALETACHYDGRLLHGEAVGIGLVLAARLSQAMNYIGEDDVRRIERHLASVGIKTEIRHIEPAVDIDATDVQALMGRDKKATADGITFVLLNKIGRAKLDNRVPADKVLSVIKGSM